MLLLLFKTYLKVLFSLFRASTRKRLTHLRENAIIIFFLKDTLNCAVDERREKEKERMGMRKQ